MNTTSSKLISYGHASQRRAAISRASGPTVELVAKPIPLLLRFSLLLFAFMLPMETLNIALSLGTRSISRLAGLFFFAASAYYYRKCYSVLPRALWCFLAWVLIFGVLGLFDPIDQSGVFVQLYTRSQLVVFFWAAANLFRSNDLSRKALLAFALGAVFFGAAAQIGLAGFEIDGRTRTSALGFNPDYLGIIFALAGTILVGLVLENLSRISLMGALAIALSMIAVSGSRGSVVAFVFGVACYLLPLEINTRKLIAILFAASALVMMGYLVMTNADFVARWDRTVNEGDSSGRDRIMTNALAMFSEKPLIGWGPQAYQYELEWRDSRIRDVSATQSSHNLELDALLETGILGAGPFLLGIALCCRSAWKDRRGELGMIRVAAIVTVLVNVQFIPYATSKPLWLILAVCAPTIRFASKRPNQRLKRASGSLHPPLFRRAATN